PGVARHDQRPDALLRRVARRVHPRLRPRARKAGAAHPRSLRAGAPPRAADDDLEGRRAERRSSRRARPRRRAPRGSALLMRALCIYLAIAISLVAADARANPLDLFGLGSRATAMGNAAAADVRDFSAGYYNPAG